MATTVNQSVLSGSFKPATFQMNNLTGGTAYNKCIKLLAVLFQDIGKPGFSQKLGYFTTQYKYADHMFICSDSPLKMADTDLSFGSQRDVLRFPWRQ